MRSRIFDDHTRHTSDDLFKRDCDLPSVRDRASHAHFIGPRLKWARGHHQSKRSTSPSLNPGSARIKKMRKPHMAQDLIGDSLSNRHGADGQAGGWALQAGLPERKSTEELKSEGASKFRTQGRHWETLPTISHPSPCRFLPLHVVIPTNFGCLLHSPAACFAMRCHGVRLVQTTSKPTISQEVF